MQQIIITLIALLGLILPVANSRITKVFQRVVPAMPLAGRIAVPAGTADSSVTLAASPVVAQAAAQQPEQRADPQQRRMRRAQRATGWRNALSDRLQALASCRGFFLVQLPSAGFRLGGGCHGRDLVHG